MSHSRHHYNQLPIYIAQNNRVTDALVLKHQLIEQSKKLTLIEKNISAKLIKNSGFFGRRSEKAIKNIYNDEIYNRDIFDSYKI